MRELLRAGEPDPVTVVAEEADSTIVLTCDHASNRIPTSLGTLGLPREDLERHIAWDIGAAGVARYLSAELGATLVLQNYSRLVVDCNRPVDSEQFIPRQSERTVVPANQSLSELERRARCHEIFHPYHRAITEILDRRALVRKPTVFVAIHSFTPEYLGAARPWHIALLYGDEQRLARSMIAQLHELGEFCIGDNEPYRIDHNDYGIPVHGDARKLPNVLVEIRQDLIMTEGSQRAWALRLAGMLKTSLAQLQLAHC